ncbi:uncharacterized protein V1513DRAFT_454083 [Lipomyces chichibuensis]|uniref:uncharacterized protein n=1 Tax=Lipomyces chichibuensis TaxID=1546026 RepID=UPI0033434159
MRHLVRKLGSLSHHLFRRGCVFRLQITVRLQKVLFYPHQYALELMTMRRTRSSHPRFEVRLRASRSSSSSSQRRSSRATLSKRSDGREMVLQTQQFQDRRSNLAIQQVNPKRGVQQWSIDSPDGLVSTGSLAMSSTTGERSTVVQKSAHTSIHSVPDFLGQLSHLETIISDLLSQMSEKQKRELDAMLLRMMWKTHVAAEPLVPVLTGLN